jgi:hypothetical protein
MTRFIRPLVVSLGALALATACEPPMHFGASIMAQANGYGGTFDGPIYADAGRTPAQAAPIVGQQTDAHPTAPVVLADVEHNGARDGAWSTADRNAEFAMIFASEACTVIVTPGYRPGLPYAATLEQAEADIRAMAAQRATLGYPTVVVDWQPIVNAHPEYLQPAPDYVHLTDDPSGGTTEATDADSAYTGLIRDGLAACP